MSDFPENYIITSEFTELENRELDGSRVSVGFRPSGELHVGNLLSIAYAAVIADKLGLELDLFCCDTDWSAPVHEQNRPENNDVMKLFYNRDCSCDPHKNLPEHRIDAIQPFLDGLRNSMEDDLDVRRLTDLTGEKEYVEALRKVMQNITDFDEIFGGGFRRRYRSPVTTFCSECGFSHAKGCDYSSDTDELVASCRNEECGSGFMHGGLDEEIGVYYLVDPVRDPSRDAAVHVFGGDYRDAKKEQKTPKVTKVAKITELATGENPAYFLGPMISDKYGKPLSKSKGTGVTVSDIDKLEKFGEELYEKVSNWLNEEKKYLPQKKILK